MVAAHLMELPLDPRPSAVIFFSGLAIYNLDHLADSFKEQGSMLRWTQGIGRQALVGLVLSSVAALVGLLLSAPGAVSLVVVAYLVVGSAYGLPVLPVWREGRLHGLRPKDLPGLKAVLVAGSISVAAVGLPLAYAAAPPGTAALAAAVFTWVFVVSNAIMCDVGDLRADEVTGVPTLPVLFGVEWTRRLLLWGNVSLAALYIGACASGMVTLHMEVLVGVLLVTSYVLLLNERTPKQRMSLLLDGCSFIPALMVLVLHGQQS
jgi:4-hydroxybenzoate polyprenyltransferase